MSKSNRHDPDPPVCKPGAVRSVPLVVPDLMTEAELIEYLRIPEISRAQDYHHVIDNLKRMHKLPRIHICGKPLYSREAIQEWIRNNTTKGKQ